MDGVDLAAFGGEPSVLGVMPRSLAALLRLSHGSIPSCGGPIDGDPVVGAQRRHPLAGPAIAMAGDEAVAVEDARDEIVIGDAARACRTAAMMSGEVLLR